jgi:hypothetical protein
MHPRFVPKTEAASPNLKQTRPALTKDAQATANLHAELGHPAYPGRFAGNILNLCPFTALHEFERQ